MSTASAFGDEPLIGLGASLHRAYQHALARKLQHLARTAQRLVGRVLHYGARIAGVAATAVRHAKSRVFTSTEITDQVLLASACLPHLFQAVEIDGEPYWDGGIVSNTPLEYILDCHPHEDTLVFQVDLWSASGARPQTMMDVLERVKDIRYSSRTRHGTQMVEVAQTLRTSLKDLIALLPGRKLPPHLEGALSRYLDDRVFNIVHLIYQTKPHEQESKDYAFGTIPLREHWDSGMRDMARTLQHPAYFALPDRTIGVATHDVHRRHRRR